MKKGIAILLVTIPLLIIGLGFFSMSKGNIEDIVICSTNEKSHYIPSGICEYYLLNFRLNKEDINFIKSRSGLAFLFDIPDKTQRKALLEYFISKGVSTNYPGSIDGYPPLHAAIINNDYELVEFLINNGANPAQKDKNQNLTPVEFIEFLYEKDSSTDRSAIKNLLSARTK